MQLSAKARLISIIVAVVFMFGALAGTGTYLIINHINKSNATTETTLSISGNLYNTDGSLNASAVSQFVDKLDFILDGAEYKSPTIADNAGVTATNSFIFNMGYYVDPQGTMHTNKPITWQAVYARNGYLTIWMIKNYTTSDYNDKGYDVTPGSPFTDTTEYTKGPYESRHNYSQSVLRDVTNRIYDLIVLDDKLDKFDTIIVTPTQANMGTNWQTTQDNAGWSVMNGLGSNTGTTNPHSLSYSSCMSDKFWIPSYYEAFGKDTGTSNYTFNGGLWGLTDTDVKFSTVRLDTNTTTTDGSDSGAGDSRYCWLRSSSL